MSDNVNALIQKMNQETLKKKKGKKDDDVSSRGSTRIRAADQEIINTDKAVSNLLKEHNKLRKRLEEHALERNGAWLSKPTPMPEPRQLPTMAW